MEGLGWNPAETQDTVIIDFRLQLASVFGNISRHCHEDADDGPRPALEPGTCGLTVCRRKDWLWHVKRNREWDSGNSSRLAALLDKLVAVDLDLAPIRRGSDGVPANCRR